MLGWPDRQDAFFGDDAPDAVWVRLPEEMDIVSSGTVVAAVREVPAHWSVVFDVRPVEFMDVAGAAEFVEALEEAADTGRRVVIRGPFAPAVERVLELADGLISLRG